MPKTAAGLQRIGRYRIVRPLSKGGMALVYEARRESLAGVSPRVALKLILPEHAASETFRDLFINEARLGSSMQHQNLVQIQDFDSEGNTYFLVMEYVEGFTLRRLMTIAERHKLRLPLSVIAEIGRQACEGLDYAHTAKDEQGRPLGLVHRDIKPSNLILTPHGVLKVLDFGISKGRLREERKGSVKGTWGYMAPEQAAGLEVGPTADVFGLGVVLYELASLRPMFSQEQPKDEMRRMLKDDHAARRVATLDAAYSPLVGVLVRALQRDPAGRYDSARAFGRALSSLLPDPITARDDLLRFLREMERLDATPKARETAALPPPSTHAAEPVVTAGPRWSQVVTFAAGASLSFALVAAVGAGTLVGLGEVLPRSALAELAPGEVAGPAADGERAPPSSRRGDPTAPATAAERAAPAPEIVTRVARPEVVEPVTIAVIRPGGAQATELQAPPAAAPDPAPTPLPPGLLTVGSEQPAEVWIDGKYVASAPARRELPGGRHEVTLVAADGRRKTFRVDVAEDKPIRKVWDFDRMGWR